MMRLAVLLLFSATLFAGCLGGEAPPPQETNSTTPDAEMAALPAPIEDSREVTGGGDPGNLATGEVCSAPTANCQRYPFTLNRTANVTGDLSWTLPASDFDFYVFQDGAQVISGASDASSGPGTSEHLEGEIEAGEYEIVVVPWGVARDTYTLTVSFA